MLGVLRDELRRLFRWLREKGVTAVVTAERGDGSLTRNGLEEYVSDCVVVLDHRVFEQITTRRLRIVKYRGSKHGTNEYPFLIGDHGIEVLPITSIGLDHPAPTERISTGIPALDAMFGAGGLYRGSTVLVTGSAGAGKTSLAASLSAAACARGERVLYIAMEESPAQIVRNMRSIGLELEQWIKRDLLNFHALRPSAHGLETHLAMLQALLERVRPEVVVIDPITQFGNIGSAVDVRFALTRMIDELKARGITALMSSLTSGDHPGAEVSEGQISSLIDAWVLLTNMQSNGERNRGLYVLKARGLGHSNQLREFRLTNGGIELVEPYIGAEGVLTGTARLVLEARERAAMQARGREIERKRRDLARRGDALEAEILALRARFAAESSELRFDLDERLEIEEAFESDRSAVSRARTPQSAVTSQRENNGRGGKDSRIERHDVKDTFE